jgi:CDP-glycerol glycerophosphotransferase
LGEGLGAFVQNVSGYPDIRDLYLAADVLITDYSSAMFDFAVTRKPIVLFAHDLDEYRDGVRGFYFDLEAEAPGPLCRTSDEIIDALGEHNARSDRYERFRQRFCPLDDGRAAARVVDRVFG